MFPIKIEKVYVLEILKKLNNYLTIYYQIRMFSTLSLLMLVSGVMADKFKRMASDSFDAFTQLPPVPPLPLHDPVPGRYVMFYCILFTVVILKFSLVSFVSPFHAFFLKCHFYFSGQNDTLEANPARKYEIDLSKTPLDLLDTDVESLTTEPYIVNHDFPEKEQTVTQTDWFNPFTNTPWANKAGKFYTVEMDNETEEKGDESNQSNSNAISKSYSIFRVNRTSLTVTVMAFALYFYL